MGFMRKIFLSFLLILVLFPVLSSTALKPVKAQGTSEKEASWYNQPFNYWFQKVYDKRNPDEIFGERYTAAQVQWIFYSIASLPFNQASELVNCASTKDIVTCTNAAREIAEAGENIPQYASRRPQYESFWDFMVNEERPISAISYIKNAGSKFSVVPEVYAQNEGFGFTQLKFIQDLWKNMRDLSYLFFVIVTVIFAFMIMFRVKISPQAVVTVQSAIPKIVIGLVFVTFSYAIAGLMIDLMYVVMGIVAQIISSTSGLPINGTFTAIWRLLSGGANAGGLFILFEAHLVLFLIALVLSIFGFMFSGVLAFGVTTIFSPLIILIFLIGGMLLALIYIWSWMKILWMLMKTTANILLTIIFSPLQITFGLLTPRGGIKSFITNLISNLAVFPTLGALIFLSLFFAVISMTVSVRVILGETLADLLLNPVATLLTNLLGVQQVNLTEIMVWSPPFLGPGIMGFVFAGISLSILMITPKIADIIKSIISGKGFDYGTAIGESVRGPAGLGIMGGDYKIDKTVERQVTQRGPHIGAKPSTKLLKNLFEFVKKNI